MFSKKFSIWLVIFVALTMILGACGQAAAPVQDDAAPLAAVEEAAPVEDVAVEESAAEVMADAEFDIVAVVDDYMSAIPDGYMNVKTDALNEMMASASPVLIDVREPGEYAEGHLPGAINIPLRTLAQNLDQIPTDQPVVVYCKSGHRAAMGTSALRILGYDNAKAFGGSYKAWTEADGAIEMEPVVADTVDVPAIEPELFAAVDDFLSTIPEGMAGGGRHRKIQRCNGERGIRCRRS